MIHDSIDHAADIAALSRNFAEAVRWLNRTDLGTLPEGRHDIAGDHVFAVAASYDTWTSGEFMLESHRRYHDIQLLVEGIERVRVLPPGVLPAVTQPYDAERDATFYDPREAGLGEDERGVDLVLRPGWFVVFTPRDVHGPNRAIDDTPTFVRKVVVKVAVD
ncbi:MAG: YhcH/YjgK/YiaL family protein [Planctomycetota bacterium]